MDLSHRTVQALTTGAVGLALVLAVRWTLGHAFARYERRLATRDPGGASRRRTTYGFLQRMIVAVAAAIAIWNVLTLYDATAQIGKALLASSAVLAVFAGLAFNTPLSNLGSGMLVAFTQPLRLGDRVTVVDQTGFVEEINLIYTTLVTDEARRVFIPNSQLTSTTIVNRTIRDPRRAIGAQFPVTLGTPIDEARDALREAIAAIPGTNGADARVLVGQIGERLVWLDATTFAPLDADVAALASEVRQMGLTVLRERGFLPA
ncbi:Mechanosensitive ion channel [Gaiella occulta]|uniref:Mechanosensitive ion channel n=1 Tax=Gaiella occulta TaxID=1002870 RepID=A0A7M2Z1C4_9ACTN|nr:mechanosensitive ion channel domain-containing protein [Gaiella occulta]RDI76216.1 Mechanosensitive ion channel [Gaiella occulta]